MSHIFISYSKQNIEFARYLRALLQEAGFRVWMDETRLQPGAHWWKDIEKNIENCAAFVIIMSTDARDSDWVEREILHAEKCKKAVFPVLYAGDPWSRLANLQFEDMRAGLHARLSPRLVQSLRQMAAPRSQGIILRVEDANIMRVEADVIALKHAQGFFGADWQVALALETAGVALDSLRMEPGEHILVESGGVIGAGVALYIGTPSLFLFDYQTVRELARQTLAVLAETAPNTRHLAMTIHGIGAGLDQDETLRSQLAGYFDALQQGTYPAALEQITIAELDERTLMQLRSTIDAEFASVSYAAPLRDGWGYQLMLEDKGEVAVQQTESRAHAYVIMPFDGEAEDRFYFGIQQPTHALGLLCEQMQPNAFDEADVLPQIMQRIKTASVVIADVSEDDAAVYLTLGYAWGCECPTILIAQEGAAVRLPGPDCLRYTSIKQLEHGLLAALNDLQEQGRL